MADHPETPYGGEYPDVKDEARSSPNWLPGLGFAILCVLALLLAIKAGSAHDEAAADEGETTAQVDGSEEADPAPDTPAAAQ